MLLRSLFAVFLIALAGAVVFHAPVARTSSESRAATQTLRVMTYNIHAGARMDIVAEVEIGKRQSLSSFLLSTVGFVHA